MRYGHRMDEVHDRTQTLPSDYVWRKSSKSFSDGNCVEIACTGQHVLVRDSKDIAGPQLKFSIKEWDSFIKYLRAAG